MGVVSSRQQRLMQIPVFALRELIYNLGYERALKLLPDRFARNPDDWRQVVTRLPVIGLCSEDKESS